MSENEEDRLTQYKSELLQKLKQYSEYAITSNEDPIRIMECLRVLEPGRYCMIQRGGLFEIRISTCAFIEIEDRISSLKQIYCSTMGDVWDSIRQANATCSAVISYLRNKDEDERKLREERIRLEQDIIRREYNSRY